MSKRSKVSYHPEFLFFNEYVRQRGLSPQDDADVWIGPDEESASLFDRFDFIVSHLDAPSERLEKTVRAAAAFLLPDLARPERVPVAEWLEFARSLRIESAQERYLPLVFKLFGTTFQAPVVALTPVRLHPGDSSAFHKMAKGRYSLSDLLAWDPPHYLLETHLIVLVLPEESEGGLGDIYELALLHELFHAPFRLSYLMDEAVIELAEVDSVVVRTLPKARGGSAFGEIFATAAALYVMKLAGHKEDVLVELARRFLLSDPWALHAYSLVGLSGVEELCHAFRKVFQLQREYGYLRKERAKIDTLSPKRMRGLLEKKLGYTKAVRGMSEAHLRKELIRKLAARLRRLDYNVTDADPVRIIAQLAAVEEDPRRREVLTALATLFSSWPVSEELDVGTAEEA